MTEAMPFLQKYDITFLTTPGHFRGSFFVLRAMGALAGESPEHAQVVGRITPDLKKHGFRWIRKQPVYFRKVQKRERQTVK